MKSLLKINIGDIFDDLKCIDIINKKLNNGTTSNFYLMECLICGRTKEMLSSLLE